MSRRDTIESETRWRVQVWTDTGTLDRESIFKSENGALAYYAALAPELGDRRLQIREAGEHFYVTIARKAKGAT